MIALYSIRLPLVYSFTMNWLGGWLRGLGASGRDKDRAVDTPA